MVSANYRGDFMTDATHGGSSVVEVEEDMSEHDTGWQTRTGLPRFGLS
jgi:hypothetical protein